MINDDKDPHIVNVRIYVFEYLIKVPINHIFNTERNVYFR